MKIFVIAIQVAASGAIVSAVTGIDWLPALNIGALVAAGGYVWKLSATLTELRIKVETMWRHFDEQRIG